MWVRTSIAFYGSFILDMDRSPGFGSAPSDSGPVKTWFPFGSVLYGLNLARCGNSPDRSTKSTRSNLNVLPQLADTGFQVLFHSPPGVLFTFPSQYYTLSVTREYLGLEGGPPVFPRDSSCPAVLRILLGCVRISRTRLSLSMVSRPMLFCYPFTIPH